MAKNNLTLASGLWIDYTIVNGLGLSPQEKMLFSMIWELSKRSEGCTASNQYFMAHLEMPTEQSVSEAIKRLKDKGLLNVRTVKIQGGSKRFITTTIKVHTPQKPAPQSIKNGVHSPQKSGSQSINCGADNIEDRIIEDKIEDNTLDASASSAAPEDQQWKEMVEGVRGILKEHAEKEIYGNKKEDKLDFKKAHQEYLQEQYNRELLEERDRILEEHSKKEEPKIPFNEIKAQFSKRHREFRKTEPIWNGPKETKGIKELWKIYGSKEKIFEAIEAFINYIKAGKGQYIETAPILPAQIPPVANQILPYFKKNTPKLEIKKYEQTGIHIGTMPEGW
jgi:hypothetical protein